MSIKNEVSGQTVKTYQNEKIPNINICCCNDLELQLQIRIIK